MLPWSGPISAASTHYLIVSMFTLDLLVHVTKYFSWIQKQNIVTFRLGGSIYQIWRKAETIDFFKMRTVYMGNKQGKLKSENIKLMRIAYFRISTYEAPAIVVNIIISIKFMPHCRQNSFCFSWEGASENRGKRLWAGMSPSVKTASYMCMYCSFNDLITSWPRKSTTMGKVNLHVPRPTW